MGLFSRPRRETVALIDIGARSVSAACAHYVGSELPVVVYTIEEVITFAEGESHDDAMLRALGVVCAQLREEGLAALERAAGEHAIDAILVSIDAPWQETAIKAERIARERDFTFTKALVKELVDKASAPPLGKVCTDVSVVATILNGYEAHNPYGKTASSAAVLILTSHMDEQVTTGIRKVLAQAFNTMRVAIIAGTSLRYQALRLVFHHERDALILDATGPLPEVALMRKSFLMAVSETPESLAGAAGVGSEDFMRGFAEVAKRYPLPRKIFLLARYDETDRMLEMVKSLNFAPLWLSDNPPKIVALAASHMNGFVRQMTPSPPDLPLLLMALYYRYLEQPI